MTIVTSTSSARMRLLLTSFMGVIFDSNRPRRRDQGSAEVPRQGGQEAHRQTSEFIKNHDYAPQHGGGNSRRQRHNSAQEHGSAGLAHADAARRANGQKT